eukprot:gnl/TRDRNA2_/TRDRNA2_40194_c0_seq1.p1 gnl/TRDRNA2_/TRDRNA2_40194_c0~~gnl/TRDRNA2_/TRDRNA2_40194_c0_seq1.p1  ORF type:complete len:498 (+),score=71.24 gnl/TRDRNA2_/TRDRNA2_40194_c0_seq1:202-1494(+)
MSSKELADYVEHQAVTPQRYHVEVPVGTPSVPSPEICDEARHFTWACEGYDWSKMKKNPDAVQLCTDHGVISPDEVEKKGSSFVLSPKWMLFSDRLLYHLRFNCNYVVESFTPAGLDPALFKWFGSPTDFDPIRDAFLANIIALPDAERSRWLHAARYDNTSSPERLELFFDTKTPIPGAPLSLEHLQHTGAIMIFEKTLDVRVSSLRSVVEFGAGTGSFSRLFKDLGFRGRHVVFDTPTLLLAQKFWNRNRGVQSCPRGRTSAGLAADIDAPPVCVGMNSPGILWQTATISELREALAALPPASATEPGLFLATYSLSEAPVFIRDQVLDLVGNSSAISHLLFQYEADMDNLFNNRKLYDSNDEYFRMAVQKRGWQQGACGFALNAYGRSNPVLVVAKDGSPVACKQAAGCTEKTSPWASCKLDTIVSL